jgi:hypothetical protein
MTDNKILGVSTRSYQRETGQHLMLSAVLVLGYLGDYAVYCGFGTPEWIARHGDKVSFEEACCHFPGWQLEREKYRK